MIIRRLMLTITALGLLSIPSACNQESAATSTGKPTSDSSKVAGATNHAPTPTATKGPTEVVMLSDANFEKFVLKADRLVLVDFYADWCGPCKILAPRLVQMAKKNDGKIIFGKLNTDHNRRTAGKYMVRALPTMIIFKDGKPVDTLVGLRNKEQIQAKLDAAARK